jgi:hypothetical protein
LPTPSFYCHNTSYKGSHHRLLLRISLL